MDWGFPWGSGCEISALATEMIILWSVCAISSPLAGNPPCTCELLERSFNLGLAFSLKNQSCCRHQKALKINFHKHV